ncbi:MAG: metallophosphoesterase [Chloroflexota bacterium]
MPAKKINGWQKAWAEMTKTLLWTSDIHLNFFTQAEIDAFLRDIRREEPDSVVISGDIGEAYSVLQYLGDIADALPCPIYFVLGNHGYYRDSIAGIRTIMQDVHRLDAKLHWLPAHGVVELTPNTAMVGHGAYADARFGDFANSTLRLNDYVLIEEFNGLAWADLGKKLNALGDEAAAYFDKHLPVAMTRYQYLVVVTHVPPFREASRHMGRISDDNGLPHFSCKAVGDVLLKHCKAHPGCQVTVLCGHTHGGGDVRMLPNLRVRVSTSDYQMQVEGVFKLR